MVKTLTLLMGIGAFLVTGTAQAGVAGDALCKEKKAKAAGKKAVDFMKAFGKNIKKPDDAKLAQDIAKAESRFTKGFSKAEDKGGCVTTGDAAAMEAKVDALVMDMVLTVTNICGDEIRAGVEQCDGTDASECPGGCLSSCTCSCDGCTADCSAYVRPDLPESACAEVDPAHPPRSSPPARRARGISARGRSTATACPRTTSSSTSAAIRLPTPTRHARVRCATRSTRSATAGA